MLNKIKLLRIREASELLGVNPETLRRWDNEGRLNAVRIGKRKDRRYKPEDIQKIIDNKKV
ncbi:MerR family transcriptional regulator [Candidatus Woesebacteria bacterium]|jgi:excisionase family DNA binding protein|nr:MerR family transcriptional regulator [Candidatus Woesebacteria bacterium]